jgi:predicted deacylase
MKTFYRVFAGIGILALAAALSASPAAPNKPRDPFVFGDQTVLPGQAASGFLEVPPGDTDPATRIPVTVLHGRNPGPVLALVTGVHAYEYPPILALYRIRDMLRGEELSGTLIIVHIANLPGFQKRIIYYNPYDWKNLNRVFPGDPKGSQSQRIAHVLNTEVIQKCDALIDMHCGDGNEALIPYTYWMIGPDPAVSEKARDMALAFGVPTIIIDDSRTQDLKDSKYLGNTALLQGKPAITTEWGYLGRTDEIAVQRNVNGVLSVMRLLRMIDGDPDMVEHPVWIDKYEVVYSKWDGLFFPEVEMGQYVAAGQPVGYITDYFGDRVETLTAPFEGIMLYIINTPPANSGEPLFNVGRVKRD